MKKNYSKILMKNSFNNLIYKFIKIFIVILFYFINISFVNAQWEECNNGITNLDAVKCFMKDSTITYAGGVGGIWMTTNNGANWTAKNKGLISILDAIIIHTLAIDGNNIFAGSAFDGIFYSPDKGENWVRKSNGLPYLADGDTIFPKGIYSIIKVGNNIFIGTRDGMYVSSDNGDNWIPKNNGLPQLDTNKRVVISIINIGNNILIGTEFGVFISSDNGDNWIPKNKGMENMEVPSLAVKSNYIYAGTAWGLFLSTDNGDNWKKIKDSIQVGNIAIKGNNIVAGGDGIHLSTDNGNTWTAKNSGLPSFGLGFISMIINGDYVFTGVDNYGIYRAKLSDLGIIADVKDQEQNSEYTIYPNPANNIFKLKFNSDVETQVQLTLYDYLGNEVLSLSEPCIAGTNEKTVDCSRLSTGYYLVKVRCGASVQTQSLVIIK